MCKWGDEVELNVPVPAHLSHTGEMRWDKKGVDRCIAPLVQALNNAHIYTANCCCGHGKEDGFILLHDGRTLVISNNTNCVELTRQALEQAQSDRDKAQRQAWGFALELWRSKPAQGRRECRDYAESGEADYVALMDIVEAAGVAGEFVRRKQ